MSNPTKTPLKVSVIAPNPAPIKAPKTAPNTKPNVTLFWITDFSILFFSSDFHRFAVKSLVFDSRA
jgi:hypothetical protein